MIGEQFYAGKVDLVGTVFDVEHADVSPAGGDIRQLTGLKARAWKSCWTCSSHPQIVVT
jgi:hypothetical protein